MGRCRKSSEPSPGDLRRVGTASRRMPFILCHRHQNGKEASHIESSGIHFLMTGTEPKPHATPSSAATTLGGDRAEDVLKANRSDTATICWHKLLRVRGRVEDSIGQTLPKLQQIYQWRCGLLEPRNTESHTSNLSSSTKNIMRRSSTRA